MGKTLPQMPMPTHHEHHSHDDHSHGDESGCTTPPISVSAVATCETACCSHDVKPAPVALGKPVAFGARVQTPIRIMQMDCPTEEKLIRKHREGKSGIDALQLNLMERKLTEKTA